MCVCVCVCVRQSETERDWEESRKKREGSEEVGKEEGTGGGQRLENIQNSIATRRGEIRIPI